MIVVFSWGGYTASMPYQHMSIVAEFNTLTACNEGTVKIQKDLKKTADSVSCLPKGEQK